MSRAAVIAGDWGTSNLRLFLCSVEGDILARKTGPGAAAVDAPFPRVLERLAAEWRREAGELPVVLCGMVGSNIGWTQVPYVPCPAGIDQIATRCVTVEDGRVCIVPGLSCTNRLDAPDVMRGEETQIIGALQLDAALRRGPQLLCLPGTHTKWVALDDGVVSSFLTAPAGELYALLAKYSVLIGDASSGPRSAESPDDAAAFARGLEQVRRFPQADLLQRIFQCRSRRLTGDLAADEASGFMSGLVIGSDAHAALRLMAPGANVHVIGTPQLTHLYAQALSSFGAAPREIDGDAAALAGLMRVHRACVAAEVAHEH